MEHIVIGRMNGSFFPYQGWPTVCADGKGGIFVAASGFRRAHVCPFGKTVLYKSTDGAKTFSSPAVIHDSLLDDRDAGIICTGDGTMLATSFSHNAEVYETVYRRDITEDAGSPGEAVLNGYKTMSEKERHGGSFVHLSYDGGNSFTKTVRLPVSAPHGPVMLKSGRLLYLGSEMYSDDLPESEEKEIVACYASDDKGESWFRLGTVPLPEGLTYHNFSEPHTVELDNGDIMGLIRAEGKGVNYVFTMYKTVSNDGGKTWSTPVCLGIDGAPPFLFRHPSGKIVLTYTRRAKPYSIRAVIMDGNGNVISDELTLDDDSDSGDMGYPSTALLPDGRMLTVYYKHYHRPDGGFDPFTSILGTIWELSEP